MPRRFSDRYFSDTTPVSPDTFNPILAEIDRAITALEETKIYWLEQVDLFNTNALKRFNDAIAPVVDQIRSAADGGFLVATTADDVALVQGEQVNFYIPPEARIAYRPTPFLAIMAPDEFSDWAVGRTVVYNDATGLLTVEILFLHGSGAQRSGWTVSASSGVTEAVHQWMTEAKAARDQAVAAAAAAAGALVSERESRSILTKVNELFAGVKRYARAASASAEAAAASAASLDASKLAKRRWVLSLLTLKADKAAVYRKAETYSRAETVSRAEDFAVARRRAIACGLFN